MHGRTLALLAALLIAAPAAHAADPKLPPIKHVFVIVLENKSFADTFGPPGRVNAPYLNNTLLPQGELLTRYYGIGHNSADNYIAMISGQPPTPASKDDCPDPLKPVSDEAVAPYGIAKSDGCDYPGRFRTIADQLTASGLTWRGYNQGIPAPCSLAASSGHYARKHNPFVFFQSLRDSGQCQQNDVGLDQLAADLKSVQTTPNLAYVVPDQCEDGHTDCSSPFGSNPISDDYYGLKQSDAFLAKWAPQILGSPAFKQDGLLIVTFDESEIDSTACCNEQPGPADPAPGSYAPGLPGAGGGVTGTVLISPKYITPGSARPSGTHLNATEYNHYSLLRSIENLFGIRDHLGYAGQAGLVPFSRDIFDKERASAPSSPSGSPDETSDGKSGGSTSGSGTQQGGNPSAQGVLGERHAAGCAARPRSAFRLTSRGRALRLRGRSTSRCNAIRVVQVAVGRRVHGGCRWLTASGRTRRPGRCDRPLWLLARGRGTSWRITVAHLRRGRYLVRVRAIDAAGRREIPRGRAIAVHAR